MTTSGDGQSPTRFFDPNDEQSHSAASPSPGGPSELGEVLTGGFRIDAKLGEGGMGTVYRGTQLSLGRSVAIKTMTPTLVLTADAKQRLFREAKILSQLNHPNIVSIIDFGTTTSRG